MMDMINENNPNIIEIVRKVNGVLFLPIPNFFMHPFLSKQNFGLNEYKHIIKPIYTNIAICNGFIIYIIRYKLNM